MTDLDALDTLAAQVFDGYLVKKDLAHSSAASTRYRPTWGSSCSAVTAQRPIRTK